MSTIQGSNVFSSIGVDHNETIKFPTASPESANKALASANRRIDERDLKIQTLTQKTSLLQKSHEKVLNARVCAQIPGQKCKKIEQQQDENLKIFKQLQLATFEDNEGELNLEEDTFDNFLKDLSEEPINQAANAFKTGQDLTAKAEQMRAEEAAKREAFNKIRRDMGTSDRGYRGRTYFAATSSENLDAVNRNNARHQPRLDDFSIQSNFSNESGEVEKNSKTTSSKSLYTVNENDDLNDLVLEEKHLRVSSGEKLKVFFEKQLKGPQENSPNQDAVVIVHTVNDQD